MFLNELKSVHNVGERLVSGRVFRAIVEKSESRESVIDFDDHDIAEGRQVSGVELLTEDRTGYESPAVYPKHDALLRTLVMASTAVVWDIDVEEQTVLVDIVPIRLHTRRSRLRLRVRIRSMTGDYLTFSRVQYAIPVSDWLRLPKPQITDRWLRVRDPQKYRNVFIQLRNEKTIAFYLTQTCVHSHIIRENCSEKADKENRNHLADYDNQRPQRRIKI